MYSPDKQEKYVPLDGAPRFSMQGLSDTLADVREGITEPPAEEYTMMLEVTMADHPGWPHPLVFSWNTGMVMHILKNDPVLRELVHLDYTSIESTMELNKPPVVRNILVITDHFTRYALVVVTKDQTAKTVAKVFYECFIAVFGVPTKLLSHRGANFTSALVEELCHLQHPKVSNHCLTCPVQWAGGMLSPDAVPHDWQAGV